MSKYLQNLKERIKNKRKKGSIIIEFLVVLPVFMMVLWAVVQIMLYVLSMTTINQAAMEGARVLSQNLRGFEGDFSSANLTANGVDSNQLIAIVSDKVQNVANYNNYVLLYRDSENIRRNPETYIRSTQNDCQNAIRGQNVVRAMCIWSTDGNDRQQEQVGVMLKARFNLIGTFFPVPVSVLELKGVGVSYKNLTNRFNFYNE